MVANCPTPEPSRRLGAPDDAARVLVFGETSHWDPNWLYTSEEYYAKRIAPIFDAVIEELERDPRRVFSLESVFFLRMHWARAPEQREILTRLVEERRLRLTGCAITTPDTVLPPTESILRDFLLGQEWLRQAGLHVEPRLVYLPDDFGYSPALPGLMRALGVDHVAITRIDGMYFVGADYRPRSAYPLAGSSAELLERSLSTLDFVWRGPDGSEVLTHWNAFTYFQGDMLAYRGVIRWMGQVYGVPWRTTAHLERRIAGYVEQLEPLSPTRYLFCPIGCDFNAPIPELMELVDRYNREVYPSSGTFLVCGGLDDYLELVQEQAHRLPILTLDPNPYWMGFYTTRPEAKSQAFRAARKLMAAEKLEVRRALEAGAPLTPDPDLTEAWEALAVVNHHDFITGTSPDRVWASEQAPLLEQAERLADAAIRRAGGARSRAARPPGAGIEVSRAHRQVRVRCPPFSLLFDEVKGGALAEVELEDRSWLSGLGNDLVAHRDTGGLWRLGHEFVGGTFREVFRASARPATVQVTEAHGGVTVRVVCRLLGATFERKVFLRPGDDLLRVEVAGRPPEGHSVTSSWALAVDTDRLTMNVPGGRVERPRLKLYDPTFWPARSLVHVKDAAGGVALFLGGPSAVSLGLGGELQWMLTRDARRETAFGLLPVLAHPASGRQRAPTAHHAALTFVGPGGEVAHALPQRVAEALDDGPWAGAPRVPAPFFVDDPRVTVGAVKPAQRGEGVVIRLHRHDGEATSVYLRSELRQIAAAWLCDARERDLAPLEVRGGRARVPLDAALCSVRVRVD